MSKRVLGWTEDKIARYLKDGRGQGEGKHYRPWLNIQDVPSSGRSHRIKGTKTYRIHHLLSDLERDYFYLLEWADEVIDLREQFPLNRELTLQIADQKHIRHPQDTSTQTPIVMTTDFLITIRRDTQVQHLARTIKPSDQLNVARTIEKFEIEREYWAERNVDWGVITERDLPFHICRNIAFFHTYIQVDENTEHIANDLLEALISSKAITLSEALSEYELYCGLEKGDAFVAFKHLVASKRIKFDMSAKFSKSIRMEDLSIQEAASSRLRRAK